MLSAYGWILHESGPYPSIDSYLNSATPQNQGDIEAALPLQTQGRLFKAGWPDTFQDQSKLFKKLRISVCPRSFANSIAPMLFMVSPVYFFR